MYATWYKNGNSILKYRFHGNLLLHCYFDPLRMSYQLFLLFVFLVARCSSSVAGKDCLVAIDNCSCRDFCVPYLIRICWLESFGDGGAFLSQIFFRESIFVIIVFLSTLYVKSIAWSVSGSSLLSSRC